MKKTLTLSLVSVILLTAFASCKKDYLCKCQIKYVIKGQEQAINNTQNILEKTTKEEAQRECVYYETEISYLGQKTAERHYCAIEE